MSAQTITDADVEAASAAVHQFLSGRLHDRAQVDDVCQEAIARLLQARDRLDSAAAIPYAVTVAKSIVVADARKAEVVRRHAHRLGDTPPPRSPEDLALQRAESAAVTAALRSLPPEERRDLIAHVVEGQPVADLAAQSGGTPGGISARLARTRARMRVDYLLAARASTLPTERCHPVLVALSAGDQRRQRALGTGHHLLECETCADLAPPLIQRQRRLVELIPVPALAVPFGWIRHQITSSQIVVATAVTAVAVIVAIITGMPSHHPRRPHPAAAPPSTISPLTSNGAALLPLTSVKLRTHAGQPVRGTSVVVQPPLAPMDGIFVGASPSDSLFVDLADPLPEPPTKPITRYQPGQKISFTGKIVANTPQYVADARDVDRIPGIQQIVARGYHVEALPTDVHR